MKKMSLLLTAATLMTMFACKKAHKPGEYAYCHITVRYDDSVMFSSYKKGDTIKIGLKAPDSLKPDILNNALLNLGVGDSTSVVQLTDTIKNKPPQLEHVKKIIYGVRLLAIKPEKQYKLEAEAQQSRENAKKEAISNVLQKMTGDSMVIRGRAKAVTDSIKMLAKSYSDGALNDKIKTTPSGLKYVILKEGAGELVKEGDVAAMHYYGVLKTGSHFDDSYARGQFFPVQVGVGQVIPGWDEGLQLLKEGSVALLLVPSQLGYGDRAMPGRKGEAGIPANSELLFYVEVLKRFDYQ
jgi:FKBP-type peptidyl-prolyl cis-trans isomerase FkpA